MSWRIEVKPTAEKHYRRMDRRDRERIWHALKALENEENPLMHRHVRALTGKLAGDCRLRIGPWRVLFTPDPREKKLYVYAILPRGDAY